MKYLQSLLFLSNEKIFKYIHREAIPKQNADFHIFSYLEKICNLAETKF